VGRNIQNSYADGKEQESVWNFTVNEAEVRHQLLKRKRQVEVQLEQQVTKRRKLEKKVNELKRTNKKQAKAITRVQTGHSEKSRGPSSSKVWNDYSRQHRSKKKIWLMVFEFL